MNALKKRDVGFTGKLIGIEDLMAYLSVGCNTAKRIGQEAGAKKKLGRRVLYDRERIDRYVDSLGA